MDENSPVTPPEAHFSPDWAFLFIPLSAYPKPRTAFLEEREDDEDISVDYGAYPCLNWKEILSQTDYYYKVKSFLVGHDALIYKNVILPKVLSPCINRLELMESMAQGDEGAQELDYNIIHGVREEREPKHSSNEFPYTVKSSINTSIIFSTYSENILTMHL